ncbi:MAG: family N-acetyltransferase [Mucilaginibacter sp.]|nr:family N-acetyltransferase [Mucilaginibacter sp.]
MPLSGENIINGYRIERLNHNRLKDMAELYEAVYDKFLPSYYFARKYNTAYTKVMYTGFLAYDKTNLPAAYYGVIPCFIQYNHELVLAAQSADTMTHPEHRNKGLFVLLAKFAYDLCRDENIKLVFGFPNQNSLPGLVNKLGWQVTGFLERFTIPVTTVPLEQLALKFEIFNGLYKAYIKQVLKKLVLPQHGIPNSVFNKGYNGVYRTDDYLQYKTYNTTYTIKIGEAIVWFKIQNGFIVGDISGFENDFDNVIQALTRLTKKLGLQKLQFQVSFYTKLYTLLKIYSEPVPAFPIIIKDLGSGIDPRSLAFTFADIDIF